MADAINSLLVPSSLIHSWNDLCYTFLPKNLKESRFLTSKSLLTRLSSLIASDFAYLDPIYLAVLKMKGHFMPLPGFVYSIPSAWNTLHFSIKIQLIFSNAPYVLSTPRSLPGSSHWNELLPRHGGLRGEKLQAEHPGRFRRFGKGQAPERWGDFSKSKGILRRVSVGYHIVSDDIL